jgi:probable F420-dependent oxidoreductase
MTNPISGATGADPGLPALGITVPLDEPLSAHADLVHRLWRTGYRDFWSAETAGHDAFTPLAYLAALLPEARFGTAIASVFTRGPALLAMSAAALAEAAPGRFTLGIGAASAVIVAQWNGLPYHEPVQRVRDCVAFLRAALSGQKVIDGYPTLPVTNFRLERPPADPPPIVLAALRPTMLRLAGQVADGAILNWLSPADVARVVPYLRTGADLAAGADGCGARAGGGGRGRVVARIFICPTDRVGQVRDVARRLIAGYLTVPGYAAFHRFLGRGEVLAPMWRAWADGDRRGAVAAVPDSVVDDLLVLGPPRVCAEQIAAYVAAGVQLPVLKFLPLDHGRDVLADAEATARAYLSG